MPLAGAALAAGLTMSWARSLGEFGATIMFAGNIEGRTQTLPLVVYSRVPGRQPRRLDRGRGDPRAGGLRRPGRRPGLPLGPRARGAGGGSIGVAVADAGQGTCGAAGHPPSFVGRGCAETGCRRRATGGEGSHEHRGRDRHPADRGADRIQPGLLRAGPGLRLPGHPAQGARRDPPALRRRRVGPPPALGGAAAQRARDAAAGRPARDRPGGAAGADDAVRS